MQAGLEPPNRKERERERKKRSNHASERAARVNISRPVTYFTNCHSALREARRSRLKEVSITLPTRYVVVSARAPVIIALYCLTIGILGTVVE